jgi:hypothetical protein
MERKPEKLFHMIPSCKVVGRELQAAKHSRLGYESPVILGHGIVHPQLGDEQGINESINSNQSQGEHSMWTKEVNPVSTLKPIQSFACF